MEGTLYVVGTPIGNLDDVTFRAVHTLRSVDTIFAEDTRVTKRLCLRYDIETPLRAYHARSGERGIEGVLHELLEGKTLALVTDAGTPGVSDPGGELVARARGAGARVIPIPGPSALTTALSISGVPTDTFTFMGFLPHKKGRQTRLKDIAEASHAVVLYESPHRIHKLLKELSVHVPTRTVSISRELTKHFESFYQGTPAELIELFNNDAHHSLGEFVVIISG